MNVRNISCAYRVRISAGQLTVTVTEMSLVWDVNGAQETWVQILILSLSRHASRDTASLSVKWGKHQTFLMG